MKIGLIPVNVGASSVEKMVGLAKKAEEVGVESVWTFEHAIVPIDYESKYPYSPNGKMGTTPETNFIDPLIALSAIAASTETIRLGTGVNILPQTNPLLLAKQAASLDFVSKGRFMLGVGIGWLREEFDAMGVPFERRGARFDDYIQAMQQVWTGEVVDHSSDFLEWKGFKSHPTPYQKPHLPVIMGGTKGKAFERVAKYGQGWFSPTMAAKDIKPGLEQLAKACEREGRDVADVEVSSMWLFNDTAMDSLKEFEDLGVSRLIVPVFGLGSPNPMEGLERLGDQLISKL